MLLKLRGIFMENNDSNLDWMRTLTLKQLSEQMEIRGIITKADFESKFNILHYKKENTTRSKADEHYKP